MPGVKDYVAPNHQEVNILSPSIRRFLNPSCRCCDEHADSTFPDGGVYRKSLFEVPSLFLAHQYKTNHCGFLEAHTLLTDETR